MSHILPILEAVMNSLWQAAIVAALVWLALRFLPRFQIDLNAATRYAIWWAALAVVLVLPVAPAALRALRAHPQATSGTAPAQPSPVAIPAVPIEPVIITVTPERTARWPLAIVAVWAGILLFRLGQITRSYFYLRGVKRRAEVSPIPLPASRRRADLLISRDIASPMAVGFARPAVVLPEALLGELSDPEREHVLLHEMAHLAGYDDWSNLAMRILGAALALHPVAVWILRRIEREREMVCDDWVVARTSDARPYAATLARLFELRWSRRREAALAPGLFGRGTRVGDRIESLLRRGRKFSPRAASRPVAVCAAILGALPLVGSFIPRWIVFAQQPARLSFEVASVKEVPRDKVTGPGRLRYNPQGVDFSNVPLSWLIGEAYGIGYNRISSSDKHVHDMFFRPEGTAYLFDIAAKADHPVSQEQIRLMLQSLLADRFALVAHKEPRELPVYRLKTGKTAPKLQAGIAGEEPRCTFDPQAIDCHNVEMARFSGILSMILDRPVLDSTGLSGPWTFTLKTHADPAAQGGKRGLIEWFASAFFSDIENELGLRLEAGKGPVEYVVVDHAEQPSAN